VGRVLEDEDDDEDEDFMSLIVLVLLLVLVLVFFKLCLIVKMADYCIHSGDVFGCSNNRRRVASSQQKRTSQ
jgi:hypothetical protein